MKARSPIEMMIDAACGYDPDPEPPKLTDEQKEACAQLGRNVVSNLRTYYPDVVKTRPTTWPLHLRNTIASQAEAMLRDILSNDKPSNARQRVSWAIIYLRQYNRVKQKRFSKSVKEIGAIERNPLNPNGNLNSDIKNRRLGP